MNKQALIKLAQIRMAINHVLRQRMIKRADLFYSGKNGEGDRTWLGYMFGAPEKNPEKQAPTPSPNNQQHINRYDTAGSTREYINGMEDGPLKDQFKRQYYDWHVAPGVSGTHPKTHMIPPPLVPEGKAPKKWVPNTLSKRPLQATGQLGLYTPSQFSSPEGFNRELPVPETPQDIIGPEVYLSRYSSRRLPPLRLAERPKPVPKREPGTLVPINRGFNDGIQLWGTPKEDFIEDMKRFEEERKQINPTGTPGADYLPYNPYG